MELLDDLDALLLSAPTNVRYITGFVPVEEGQREVQVLLLQQKMYLFTNALYKESVTQLAKKLKNADVMIMTHALPMPTQLHTIASKEHLKTIGFEDTALSVAEFERLKRELPDVSFAPASGRVEQLRMIKRNDEIENIRRAATITDACFDSILSKLKPGVTESDIAWEIETFFRTHGAENAFSPIVAFDPHSSQPHFDSSRAQGPALGSKQVILLDFGASVNGYCGDMTRVVCMGKPTDEQKKAYTTVFAAQQIALDYLHEFSKQGGSKQNNPSGYLGSNLPSGAEADKRARMVIEKAGFPAYPHSLGHAVGLDIHETPRLTVSQDAELKPGMVVTVEPAIYKEGQYGIRIEDLVLLKKDGIEILSKSPKHLTIL